MNQSTVLIVDDNLDFGEGLTAVLEDEGYEVSFAPSGREAISLHNEQRFDMTLMDMKLPDMTGIEALMEIRSRHPDAVVVMMSGYRVDTLLEEAILRGAKSVLGKPFTMEQMLAEFAGN
jgi:CheY-like chemotaxis protein